MKQAVAHLVPYHRGRARTRGRGGRARRRAAGVGGHDRHGHRQGRRPRHRQEHRGRRARLQRLRGHRPGRHGALDAHPGDAPGETGPTSSACPGSSRPRSRRCATWPPRWSAGLPCRCSSAAPRRRAPTPRCGSSPPTAAGGPRRGCLAGGGRGRALLDPAAATRFVAGRRAEYEAVRREHEERATPRSAASRWPRRAPSASPSTGSAAPRRAPSFLGVRTFGRPAARGARRAHRLDALLRHLGAARRATPPSSPTRPWARRPATCTGMRSAMLRADRRRAAAARRRRGRLLAGERRRRTTTSCSGDDAAADLKRLATPHAAPADGQPRRPARTSPWPTSRRRASPAWPTTWAPSR